MSKVLVVASPKGGVGKTTLAYELAYLLDAVLLDLEWDGGSASRRWGYRPGYEATDPLFDALEKRRTPRPRRGFRKADLEAYSGPVK